jgi:hypothetical protein
MASCYATVIEYEVINVKYYDCTYNLALITRHVNRIHVTLYYIYCNFFTYLEKDEISSMHIGLHVKCLLFFVRLKPNLNLTGRC